VAHGDIEKEPGSCRLPPPPAVGQTKIGVKRKAEAGVWRQRQEQESAYRQRAHQHYGSSTFAG
jgi:hypothetical protein